MEICVELLHILGAWLADVRFKHYFISNCNLLAGIDNPHSIQLIGNRLRSRESLAKWYINNYIRQCTYGSTRVSRLFDDISTNAKIRRAVSAIVDIRLRITSDTFSTRLRIAQCLIMEAVSNPSLTVRSTCLWMTELAKFDHCLPVYFIGIAFLHVAFKTTRDSLTDELLDVLATIYRLARQTSNDEDLKRFYESIRLFIGDVLGLTSVRREQNVRYERKLGVREHSATPVRPVRTRRQMNESELVELLQQSAVEHLTTCNQLQARDHYEHCLRTQTMALYLELGHIALIVMYPEMIQLMEDDIVSLMGLVLILDPSYTTNIGHPGGPMIAQLSLSLYLMTECQIKLRQSLRRTHDYVEVAARRLHWSRRPLDKLLLKLVERKIQYITGLLTRPQSTRPRPEPSRPRLRPHQKGRALALALQSKPNEKGQCLKCQGQGHGHPWYIMP